LGVWNLSLTRKDLPHSDIGLEGAQSVSAQRLIRNLIDCFRHINKAGDGLVA